MGSTDSAQTWLFPRDYIDNLPSIYIRILCINNLPKGLAWALEALLRSREKQGSFHFSPYFSPQLVQRHTGDITEHDYLTVNLLPDKLCGKHVRREK